VIVSSFSQRLTPSRCTVPTPPLYGDYAPRETVIEIVKLTGELRVNAIGGPPHAGAGPLEAATTKECEFSYTLTCVSIPAFNTVPRGGATLHFPCYP